MIHQWLRACIELPPACELLFKITILLTMAWALHLVLRRGNPYWRVLLWRGFGTAILATPLLILVTPEIPVAVPAASPMAAGPAMEQDWPLLSYQPEPLTVAAPQDTAAGIPAAPIAAQPPWTTRAARWITGHGPALLAALWATGSALLLGQWILAWLRLRRIIALSTAAGEHYWEPLRRAQTAVGCHARVRLRFARGLSSPLLASVRTPTILIPEHLATRTSPAELQAILAHELCHLNNRDLLWMAILRGLTILLWWHPLAWRLCQAHGEACEEACDAAAATIVGDPAAYSRTLARLALAALAPAPALAGIPMARPAQIVRRLSRLAMRMNASRPGLRHVLPAGLLAAAVSLGLSGLQLVGTTMAAPETRPADAAARVLHFPTDRSLGTLFVQDAHSRGETTTSYHWMEDETSNQWDELGPARGDVTIPAGKRVHLRVEREGWKDLSPLASLAPDDLEALSFSGSGLTAEESEDWGILRAESADDAVMPHVARLTGLKSLHLNLTCVTGKALRHLEGFQSLESLSLPCRMDDEGMPYVARLTGLKRLYFTRNTVTNRGLAALKSLRNLEELELGGKAMSDGGLVHLKSLPRLNHLTLWGTTFTDAGMAHVAQVSSLKIFHPFRMNTIGDQGLAHLAKLPNLQRLALHYNEKITDAGMAHVARMRALRQLNLSHTKIGDAGAKHLQKLPHLELLNLPSGLSSDALVALLANQPRLRSLECGTTSNSPYGNELCEQIGKMADLEEVTITGRRITDAGMTHLTNCRKLRKLMLFYCPITNKGLAELGRIKSLTNLDITGARLTTSGLKQLNGLTHLTYLRLSQVEPDEEYADLSGLTNLRKFTWGDSSNGEPLRDADLASLAKLKNLEWFQMSFGRGITDAGLAHLAGLTQMKRLSIGDELTDAGLAHLANMKQLNSLTIAGNFTEKGLLTLGRHSSLAYLWVATPRRLSNDIADQMAARLPNLSLFHYGPDSQHMRPLQLSRP